MGRVVAETAGNGSWFARNFQVFPTKRQIRRGQLESRPCLNPADLPLSHAVSASKRIKGASGLHRGLKIHTESRPGFARCCSDAVFSRLRDFLPIHISHSERTQQLGFWDRILRPEALRARKGIAESSRLFCGHRGQLAEASRSHTARTRHTLGCVPPAWGGRS